jgi:hypothetical protein
MIRSAGARLTPRPCAAVKPLDQGHMVEVSPRHSVTVDGDYFALIERAPQQDFVVRTLARTMVGGTPLMVGELVIAGQATRERYPLAAAYALHFRKTYYPGRLRGNTEVEFERHTRASEALGMPPPIGHAGTTFRSCLFPGRPFARIMPFGTEPEGSNIKHAESLPLASAAGLWLLAERVFVTLTTLHRAGLTHGDAELHNFIVCYAPVDVLPIDFEMSVLRDAVSEEDWKRHCTEELDPLFKVAVFLQCALGVQQGDLAELSLGRMESLFRTSEPFRRAIESRSALLAPPLT